MSLESIVQSVHGGWSDTERAILAYLIDHQREAAESSVQQVARKTYTSTSSIMRITKRLGFSGFAELKYYLRHAAAAERTAPAEDPLALQEKDVRETLELLRTADLDPVLDGIESARTVYFFGTGFAQRTAAQETAKSLMVLGIPALLIPDLTELRAGMNTFREDDLMVLVSLSGNTETSADIPDMLSYRGVPTLAVTRLGRNRMAEAARWNLHYSSTPMHTAAHTGPFHSFIGLNLVLDHLVRRLIVRRSTRP